MHLRFLSPQDLKLPTFHQMSQKKKYQPPHTVYTIVSDGRAAVFFWPTCKLRISALILTWRVAVSPPPPG